MFSLSDFISSAMQQAKEELGQTTATIDQPLVQVVINGNGQVQRIAIRDETTDTATLEAALVEAVNAAILASQQLARDAQIAAMWGGDDNDEDEDEWPDDFDVAA